MGGEPPGAPEAGGAPRPPPRPPCCRPHPLPVQARPGERPEAGETLCRLVPDRTDSQPETERDVAAHQPDGAHPGLRAAVGEAGSPRLQACRKARPERTRGWRDPREPRLKLPRGPRCPVGRAPRTRRLREASARAINST